MVLSGVPLPGHIEALAQLALDMRDAGADLHHPKGRRVPLRIGSTCLRSILSRASGGQRHCPAEYWRATILIATCDGRAGAVLAIEAPRLARNGRDWHIPDKRVQQAMQRVFSKFAELQRAPQLHF